LAPQFDGPRLCDDDWSVSPDLVKTKELLDHLMKTYSIDPRRVYTTGQSMGYLAGCELNIRYPDFFAGSLMVSGFWNPGRMACLGNKNMWFFVSEGDTRAYINTISAVENIEKTGAKVGRYRWDGRLGKAELERLAKLASDDGCGIKLTVFDRDSTVPVTATINNEATNHRGVWQLVYDLEAVRDWLFNCMI
jgi:predicted peptidase